MTIETDWKAIRRAGEISVLFEAVRESGSPTEYAGFAARTVKLGSLQLIMLVRQPGWYLGAAPGWVFKLNGEVFELDASVKSQPDYRMWDPPTPAIWVEIHALLRDFGLHLELPHGAALQPLIDARVEGQLVLNATGLEFAPYGPVLKAGKLRQVPLKQASRLAQTWLPAHEASLVTPFLRDLLTWADQARVSPVAAQALLWRHLQPYWLPVLVLRDVPGLRGVLGGLNETGYADGLVEHLQTWLGTWPDPALSAGPLALIEESFDAFVSSRRVLEGRGQAISTPAPNFLGY